jgi:outer membrane protein insertion porin family
VGWSRDARDSLIAPTRGRYQRLNLELGAAGDTRYLRGDYQFQQFIPLNEPLHPGSQCRSGIRQGACPAKSYPVISRTFYGGGSGNRTRGFEQNTH